MVLRPAAAVPVRPVMVMAMRSVSPSTKVVRVVLPVICPRMLKFAYNHVAGKVAVHSPVVLSYVTLVQVSTLSSLLWLSLLWGTVTLTTISLAISAVNTAGLSEDTLPLSTMGLADSLRLMRPSPVTRLRVVERLLAPKFQLVALAMPA